MLIASQIMIWVAIAILAVLVAALARQVGALHQRIAPAGALTLNRGLKAGDLGPAVVVPSIDGKQIEIGGVRARSQLLFFLSPDCPICKGLVPALKSSAAAEIAWLDYVFVSDGNNLEDHRRFINSARLTRYPYVLSQSLGRALQVSKLPYAVLLGTDGTITSMGLVNSREHLESLFEAKERGFRSIQQFLSRG